MENTKLEDPGETHIKQMVILRIIDDELHVNASEDLDSVFIAGMLYKALEAVHYLLADVDKGASNVVH